MLRPFSTAAAAAAAAITRPSTASPRVKSKLRRDSPEGILRHHLDMCSKDGNLLEALRLYDEARATSVPLSLHCYNSILYLCASAREDCPPSGPRMTGPGAGSSLAAAPGDAPPEGAVMQAGLERGSEIYHQMCLDGIKPNEATFTSLARLALAKEDPELAFEILKEMKLMGIAPKLRSYGPALFGFCRKGDAEGAYAVERHMEECSVVPEEAELASLLEVSSRVARGDEVYRLMHKLRASVRQVSEETAQVVEGWFRSAAAAAVGVEEWDVRKVAEGVVSGGGGWHGQGWLGTGRWDVVRSEMEEGGVCKKCKEQLVCIDIDPLETENFAKSLSSLACKKEKMKDFLRFQEWLHHHGPYDAIIDGANVGLYKQRNFSFHQIKSIINGIREMSPSKRMPLVILHNRRLASGPADIPFNRKLIESWRKSGVLYATPIGSNDDWYWLYAAVSCNALLVTNDEMRDHLFQLLGDSFFPRWKEKHQVRLTFSKHGPSFHLPPPYSIVTQESETGNWHVPTIIGDDIEMPRQWVCASRPKTCGSTSLREDVGCHTQLKTTARLRTESS